MTRGRPKTDRNQPLHDGREERRMPRLLPTRDALRTTVTRSRATVWLSYRTLSDIRSFDRIFRNRQSCSSMKHPAPLQSFLTTAEVTVAADPSACLCCLRCPCCLRRAKPRTLPRGPRWRRAFPRNNPRSSPPRRVRRYAAVDSCTGSLSSSCADCCTSRGDYDHTAARMGAKSSRHAASLTHWEPRLGAG